MGYFLLAVVVGFLAYQIIELYRDIKRKKRKKEDNENGQIEQDKTE